MKNNIIHKVQGDDADERIITISPLLTHTHSLST
jgi:hypothetical protein